MPRKKRFTHFKNGERKKQAAKRAQLDMNQLYLAVREDIDGWVDLTDQSKGSMSFRCKSSNAYELTIHDDFSWEICIHGRQINHTMLALPKLLNKKELIVNVTHILSNSKLCPGNPDKKFIDMILSPTYEGKIRTSAGSLVAEVIQGFSVWYNGKVFNSTVRTTDCTLIVGDGKCNICQKFRSNLRSMYSRFLKKKKTKSKYCNNRYLSSAEQLKKLKNLQSKASNSKYNLKRLRKKIKQSYERNSVIVDQELHSDLHNIMEENKHKINDIYPKGSFRRLFWEEQLKVARLTNSRQMRWHPMMVRWCLNLKFLSTAAYHALRTSGMVKLPSERTLRDYTHYIKSAPGFSEEVDQMLEEEAKSSELPDWKRHVTLVLDEMKVKESLVYNKHQTKVIGFVNMGDIGDHLDQLERDIGNEKTPHVATHVLTLMIRGIFFHLHFPYATFATTTIKSDYLFLIVWEAIERLEKCGFKVIVVTADGASPNRKFFRMHQSDKDDGLCYKTKNPYASDERYVYFMSDVPHLLKTTRNCWSHSSGHGNTRNLWVRKQLAI